MADVKTEILTVNLKHVFSYIYISAQAKNLGVVRVVHIQFFMISVYMLSVESFMLHVWCCYNKRNMCFVTNEWWNSICTEKNQVSCDNELCYGFMVLDTEKCMQLQCKTNAIFNSRYSSSGCSSFRLSIILLSIIVENYWWIICRLSSVKQNTE